MRERSTVERRRREHPGANLISRNRSAVYADAIREAAPEAMQGADYFHLLKNLIETLKLSRSNSVTVWARPAASA